MLHYYIDSFGCAKNQVDSENMMAFLNQPHPGGAPSYSAVSVPEDADLIIVNSCGFIESAKRESIDAVLVWKKLYPEKKILLAGCLAERYAKELAVELPEADGFFGVSDISKINEAVNKLLPNTPHKNAPRLRPAPGKRPLLSLPGSAYIKISEGCNNRCSFCAIPLIRGSLQSRNVEDIVDECRILLERGIKELCIIAQDIASYGKDAENPSGGLPELLKALSHLTGEFWVRLLYIHPDNFPLSILDVMKDDGRFLPYFDLPFQHGSEKILKLMNRRLTAEAYLGLVETIRSRLEDAVIRTTLMTGFPGEDEDDFSALLDFQEKARFDWMGCFAYSREEDTAAYTLKNRVPKKTAAERKRIVEELQVPITEKQMDRFVGREFKVLAEEKFEGEDGMWLGRLPCQAPGIDGSAVISAAGLQKEFVPGSLVKGRVLARAGFDLEVVCN